MDDYSTTIARDQTEGHKVLLELEAKFNKKARSAALSIQGSQIQALIGFIHIFEQYPYPVVINAAILKLADWFRNYNNNVKYYVYKVFKDASDLHLAKLINVEETVRRILPLLGSNDPVARAITLRVLGCMSMIISEKLDVQFGIIQRLELATDKIELEAAIWAVDQICAKSKRFHSVIFSKAAEKLEDPSTSFDIKLRLVKIFRHMHQDIGMARQAKLTCLKLLDNHNTDTKLAIATLRTLTLLLSEAVIDRKEQIDRLLSYALEDKREDVCYNVIYDLFLLGKNDIMFDKNDIIRLLQVTTATRGNLKIQQRAFKCTHTLIETHRKLISQIIALDPSSDVLQQFTTCVFDCEKIMEKAILNKQYAFTISCAKLLYSILKIAFSKNQAIEKRNLIDVDMQTLPKLKELAYRIAERIKKLDSELINQDKDLKPLSKSKLLQLLKVKAHFCLLLDDWDCDNDFKDAYELLTQADDEVVSVLLPYLSSISKKCKRLTTWFPNDAIKELKKRVTGPSVYVNLARLYLRTTKSQHELTLELVSLLKEFGKWDEPSKSFLENGWNLYLIGMEAGTCGWFELMHIIMSGLCKKVETEVCSYWISSLASLAHAEWTLSTERTTSTKGYLAAESKHFLNSLTQLKALQALDQPRTAQSWFIQLRLETINIIQHTLSVIQQIQTKDHGPLLKTQSKQMQKCAIKFRKVAFRYDFAAQSQFGIDREMLKVMECYKICALVFEHAARTFDGSGQLFFCIDPSLIPLIDQDHEASMPISEQNTKAGRMIELCKKFLSTISGWEEMDHLEGVDRRLACGEDMEAMLKSILEEPLILPRSFFENRRNLIIQLTTEPGLGEKKPITLQANEDLVIKFEGLVQVAQHAKHLEKKIKKAVIVCFATTEKILHFDDRLGVSMMFAEPLQTLTASENQSVLLQPPTIYIANVRNSYFTYTGLLSLPKPTNVGLPTSKREAWINVFVKVIDENESIWSVGPQQWGKVIY